MFKTHSVTVFTIVGYYGICTVDQKPRTVDIKTFFQFWIIKSSSFASGYFSMLADPFLGNP
jgi:hypothetical protein